MAHMRPHSRPGLVLLPGLDGTGELFSGFRNALSPGIRTTVVSYPPDPGSGYAELEAIARSLPVLYLRAAEDRLVPRSAAAVLTMAPQIRLIDIEGPHFLLQARPSATAAHVEAFLREVHGRIA
jgi:hypothetical protein